MSPVSKVRCAALLLLCAIDAQGEQARIKGTFDQTWSRARAALEHRGFDITDDFKSIGILHAKLSSSNTNGMQCPTGRGTFVKAEISATITVEARASGQISVDVDISASTIWYGGDQAPSSGTRIGSTQVLPCTSTGDLEHQILEYVMDPAIQAPEPP